MPRRIKRRKPRLKLLSLPGGQSQGSSKLNAEQMLDRREKAFRLRLIDGKSYDEIGRELGIGKEVARKDCQWIYDMKAKGMVEKDSAVLVENSAFYENILSVWLPLLKPLIDGRIKVGETKYDRMGKEYDITIQTYEAAKTATEMILRASLQRERLHGYPRTGDSGKPSEEALKGAGMAVFELMRAAVSQPPSSEPKIIQATEVIPDGQHN